MPNHVTNRLRVANGNLADIVEKIKDEKELIDFNKIIPMPESLDVRESPLVKKYSELIPRKVKSYDEVPASIIDQITTEAPYLKDNAEELKGVVVDAIKTRDNHKLYGYGSWYGWRYEYWGTKWNAYETSVEDDSLLFQTAWATPKPVIEALSKMFPDLKIEVAYADEDFGYNCGVYTYLNGERIEEWRPEGGSSQARELASDVLGWAFDEEEEDE